mmetsp:Transcript_62819/g.152934  ORF Transcript_62819/g.152934 Transcript_62819/m.152934 type:complete len:288 (+) Transcript_62819:86-949(+)
MIFRNKKLSTTTSATDTTISKNVDTIRACPVVNRKSRTKLTVTAARSLDGAPSPLLSSSSSSSSSQNDLAVSAGTSAPGIPLDVEKRKPQLYKKTKLVPLDLLFSCVNEKEERVGIQGAHEIALKSQVVNARTSAQASVLFVVKRPGCILCHEQGHDLKQLIKEFPAESVGAFGCVKEINVDNEGLLSLYQNHFRFPFFRDTNWNIYKVLGHRRVSIPTALWRYRSAKTRWERKGLRGNMVGSGEGMVLGGVMVFDRKGQLQYAYKEEFGMELPVDEIRTAIQTIIN